MCLTAGTLGSHPNLKISTQITRTSDQQFMLFLFLHAIRDKSVKSILHTILWNPLSIVFKIFLYCVRDQYTPLKFVNLLTRFIIKSYQ